MRISSDRFEDIEAGDAVPAPWTNADEVLSFLAANADKAFTRGEIVEATDVKQGSIGPTLVRLREAGRVDHRGQYWRLSDHKRSLNDAVEHAAAVAASHEADSFDYDDWMEHAGDPRKERE